MTHSTGICVILRNLWKVADLIPILAGKWVGCTVNMMNYKELQGVNGRQRGKDEGGRMSKTRRGGKDEKGSREWFAKCYVVEK